MEFSENEKERFQLFFDLREKKEYTKAISILKKLNQGNKNNSIINGLLGTAFYEISNYASSKYYFKKTTILNEKSELAPEYVDPSEGTNVAGLTARTTTNLCGPDPPLKVIVISLVFNFVMAAVVEVEALPGARIARVGLDLGAAVDAPAGTDVGAGVVDQAEAPIEAAAAGAAVALGDAEAAVASDVDAAAEAGGKLRMLILVKERQERRKPAVARHLRHDAEHRYRHRANDPSEHHREQPEHA